MGSWASSCIEPQVLCGEFKRGPLQEIGRLLLGSLCMVMVFERLFQDAVDREERRDNLMLSLAQARDDEALHIFKSSLVQFSSYSNFSLCCYKLHKLPLWSLLATPTIVPWPLPDCQEDQHFTLQRLYLRAQANRSEGFWDYPACQPSLANPYLHYAACWPAVR